MVINMKKLFFLCVTILLMTSGMRADNKITLKDVTGQTFSLNIFQGLIPYKEQTYMQVSVRMANRL